MPKDGDSGQLASRTSIASSDVQAMEVVGPCKLRVRAGKRRINCALNREALKQKGPA
jgi:hypothetical protein